MQGKSIRSNGLLLFLFFVIITFAGCGDKEINSKWRTQGITIDGNDSDWGSSLVYYEDINSLVGVQNDKDYLYLCLVTTDQQIEKKILMMGLTVWFDNAGKGDKKFGVRFPLMKKNISKDDFKQGEELGEGRRRDSDDGREGPGDNGQPGVPPEHGRMEDKVLRNQTEIEVVDSKEEATRVPISQLKGVELKMAVKDYRMVYEIKIPINMKSGFSYAVGVNNNGIISVGLETGAMEPRKNKDLKEKSSGEGGEGESSSGEGIEGSISGGDEMGGRGGRGRRGEQGVGFNRSSLQPIKFWADIKLSTGSN